MDIPLTAPTANPFFQTLIEASDFGIMVLDAAGRISAWNPWLAERTSLTEGGVLGKTLPEAAPGTPDITSDTCARVMATGQPRILSPVLHKVLIPFTKPSLQVGRFLPVQDADGLIAGLVIFLHDITPTVEYERLVEDEFAAERRRAEAELRENEEKFKAVFETANVGKSITALNGEIMVNKAFCEMLGYAPEDLKHKTWQELTPPEDVEASQQQLAPLLTGEKNAARFIKRYLHKGGSYVWADLSVTLRRDQEGKPLYYITTIVDITERMSTAEALKLSEERYRAFVKQSSEAICLFELEHAPLDTSLPPEEQIDRLYAQAVIGECNQNFAASHGYERPEDMFGFRIGQIFPRLAPENVNYLRSFIENGHQLSDVETKELARDGTVKYFLNSLIGQVENGRLLRVWGAKQDITRLKKAEEEIRSLNVDLERRVRDRTAELEAFAYSVSHDLRAPLRAIDGYTRMLTEDYGKLFDAEGQRICGVISDSARDMGKLIEDLLSFSRIGRAELRRIAVDMTVLAESVYREATAPAERVRIDFHLAPLPPAQGDPVLLRQVWMNLLGNAVKFSRRQERAVIEVGVTTAGTDRERGISAASSGSPVVAAGGVSDQATQTTREEPVYFVRDNGAGFDMAYAGKLFGVFQRLHSARDFEGTGVGLAIVQRIIHRHGGRIWAEGAVGKGATFYFTLPA